MIIPAPTVLDMCAGSFLLDDRSTIAAAPGTGSARSWLRARLSAATGFDLPAPLSGRASIEIGLDPALGAEDYRLDVGPQGVRIAGGDAAGAFYGAQSFVQLLPPDVYRSAPVAGVRWSAPAVRIGDSPRFPWRGVMLDVARHFLPPREVLRFIELMAAHRLNRLHLHLTDDQGWRVEIKRYPRLTSVGGWRAATQLGKGRDPIVSDGRPHGGYYTQADLREIVAYAAERHIVVVPEIDCPGHTQAAIAAYPELGLPSSSRSVGTTWGVSSSILNLEESTVEFFQNVLDEVMEIFPGPVIGIGADECITGPWDRDERTAARMAELGLASTRRLQPWFVGRMETHLASRGRRLFGWDEVLDGPPLRSDTLIAAWRGRGGITAAASRGFDVVACPDDEVYFDYRQSEHPAEPTPVGVVNDLRTVFDFDPVPADLGSADAAHVLGGQANLWSEHIDGARMLDYYAFPRVAALAEALWSWRRDGFGEFLSRLDHHLARLDALGVEYRRSEGPLPWQTRPDAAGAPLSREERARIMDLMIAGVITEYSTAGE